ncbi:GTP pyrophosphokinase [Tabrizicola sp. TH137]|uniref:HD domain-containing protein n=1 Tax=Tabrizicola sp. TH137 TaxID=2067452 RepID=UPI000C7D7EB3|nr:HD domain-containing protein [Tabrizicola sp. TH137]PLL10228.1 GTP pyrophosphokinase [Tabrizicola sp. TH137]
MNLQRAIEIAAEAHREQTDKAGAPYLLHPLRVMMSLDTDEERIVGVLHDVVEDGPGWTFERLEKEGFGPAVLDALRLVTKRPEDAGDSEAVYVAFVRRTLGNKIARRVKMADILDNLNASRLSALTEKDMRRMNRYLAALRELRDADA